MRAGAGRRPGWPGTGGRGGADGPEEGSDNFRQMNAVLRKAHYRAVLLSKRSQRARKSINIYNTEIYINKIREKI